MNDRELFRKYTSGCLDMDFVQFKQALTERDAERVCKWEQQGYEYKTSCNEHNSYPSIVDHFDFDNWEYCPYCGGTIQRER